MNQPYWRGVLTGIIVGAGAALLLAPKRGEELREELLESADDWKDKAAERAHDLKESLHERGSDVLDEAKKTAAEVSTAVSETAKVKLESARETVTEKRDEIAEKIEDATKTDDDSDHHEVEVGAAMAAALSDDEMTAQAEAGGEVQNVAGDDIAPTPGVRAASEQTLNEIQTQSPESNTEPEAAQAAQAQPLEDKIAAAVQVARENDDETANADISDAESKLEAAAETVSEKAEEVKEVVADKASDAADAAAEKVNDEGEKTPDAVIDAPENDVASKNNSSSKRRGKNRRKRSANS